MPDIKSLYIHQVAYPSLAPNATDARIINVESDSDFYWYKATFFADIGGGAQTDSNRVIPLVTVLITDQGSGRQIMKSEVPVASIFGTGEIPFILPQAHKFVANATFSVAVTNVSLSSTYRLYLNFIGYKKFLK